MYHTRQNWGCVNGGIPTVLDSSISILKGLSFVWHGYHIYGSVGSDRMLLALHHGESFVSITVLYKGVCTRLS